MMNQLTPQRWLLVVEDQLDLWLLLRWHFQQTLLPVEPVHAISQLAALTCLDECSQQRGRLPGMILQDLHLPHRADGFGLLTQLKQPASPYGHIPVLVMSSELDAAGVREADQGGAISCLAKPFESQEWLPFINKVAYYWNTCALA